MHTDKSIHSRHSFFSSSSTVPNIDLEEQISYLDHQRDVCIHRIMAIDMEMASIDSGTAAQRDRRKRVSYNNKYSFVQTKTQSTQTDDPPSVWTRIQNLLKFRKDIRKQKTCPQP